MIRASNINRTSKTCDFHMDEKDAYVIGYDIMSLELDSKSEVIIVPGSLLIEGADAGSVDVINTVSCYPTVNGNSLAQELAEVRKS